MDEYDDSYLAGQDDAVITVLARKPQPDPEPPPEDGNWIPTWVRMGNRNPWISNAWDPPFDEKSFAECATLDELVERIKCDNWCLGTAFYLGDLCFIQQVNGPGEWLVIRRNIPFESLTTFCSWYSDEESEASLRGFVARVTKATDEQLKKLEY